MKRILKFYSPTCGPCKVMSKTLEEVSRATGVEVQNIDINDEGNENLIEEWKPRTIPTVFTIDSKEVVHEFKGIVNAQKIIDSLNE